MSAQPSLQISTRIMSSQTTEIDNNALQTSIASNATLSSDLPASDESHSIIDLQLLDTETAKALESQSKLKKLLSEENTNAENSHLKQLGEIEAIQNNLLNDSDFDFSSLPSTASGIQDGGAPSSQSNFASESYIEAITQTASSPQTDLDNNIALEGKVEKFTPSNANTQTEINDAQKTLGTNNQSVTEDMRIELAGEIDTPHLFNAGSYKTDYGQIEYDESGAWHYTLDNSSDQVQSLSANEYIVDSISLLSKGGDIFTLNITINGTNDNARIDGDIAGEVSALSNTSSEERPETIEGKLSVTDADSNEAQMYAEDYVEGTYGHLKISSEGDWTYSLDSQSEAVKSLHASDSLYDLIPVKSADGTSQLIKITIHGADDNPLLSGDNSETIDLAKELYATQKLNIEDPDFGQSHFIANNDISTRSNYGTGSVDEHGNWRYDLNTQNPKVASLGADERLFDTFAVESVDGTSQTIIIKIQGSDNPLFAHDNSSNDEFSQGYDAMISNHQTSDAQESLDAFLGKDSSLQATNSNNDASTGDTSSAGEILQQLTQQSSYDGSHVV